MNTANILLVDDEPNLQTMVSDQLRLEGYDVTSAYSGDEALQAMRLKTPDLIILDISMPGMTGLALLKKLSGPDGKPRYPILVFSARSNMEQFFSTTGVEGFLPKTADPNQLSSEVKRILLKTQLAHSPAAEPAAKARKTIVILEDEPTASMRMKVSFNIAGYHTITVADCHDLAGILQNHTPAIILLKSLLPGTTGSAVAASLRDYTTARRIPILLYDGSGIHKGGTEAPNVTKFIASNTPADLLKTVTSMLS